jgi:large subunit ribosomal protein L31
MLQTDLFLTAAESHDIITPDKDSRGEIQMKREIQPELKLVIAKCTCGAEHKFWSTKESVRIDLCSNCHPYYKGDTSSMIIDTEGRVQKFRTKFGDDY